MTKKEFEQAQREVFAAATPEQRAQIIEDQRARDKAALDKQRAYEDVKANLRNLRDFPEYLTEDKNPNVLFKGGPWLERGGGAFIIGTAGIGKSIFAMQFMLACAASVEFCGIVAAAKLRVTYIQSEDSDNRVAHDFADCLMEMQEKHPDVDWNDAASRVDVYNMTGKTGAAFLEALDLYLFNMTLLGKKPDLVVINPLLAFIGGAITDSAYVTPFLRGGRMPDGTETIGLQAILEKHHVGVLIFHHTPKPPTEKEIDAWMKSTFPEYQGAGSADITNWGRSFLMIMRVKGKPGYVCVTAGKNGSRLGWEQIGGAYRHYLAYSGKPGVDGLRNAWRELTEAEYQAIVDAAKTAAEKDEASKKVTDIDQWVVMAIDLKRMETLDGGKLWQGVPQGDLIKKVTELIEQAERRAPGEKSMRTMLAEHLPDGIVRCGNKPIMYGTRDDLAWYYKRYK